MRRTMIVLMLAVAFAIAMSLGGVAMAGPQPMPASACNPGALYAHEISSGWESMPHLHDFDADGTSACYHFNPTYPAAGPGAE